MSGDLIAVLDYLEREKGIERETLILAIESSLLSASRKSVGTATDVSIEVDRKTLKIRAFGDFDVVKKVSDPQQEIDFEKAKTIDPDCQIGDKIKIEVTPKNFGRIAAQTAKQIMIQKIREAERDIIFNEYRERIGEIVTGLVRRYDHGNVVIDLGKTEAIMPYNEKCPIEDYPISSRFRGYVVSVKTSSKGPEIVLSRSHPNFVKRLFELEVPEIYDETVEVKAIAREAGYRTKIAVFSSDEKVDPVGACVGMRGSRVKNIVNELSGEKIDIIPWSEDVATFVKNALSPAKVKHIDLDTEHNAATVIVEADQLSLAIGKKGQNVRLTSKLVGVKVDVKKIDEENGIGDITPNLIHVPTQKTTVNKFEGAIEQAAANLMQISCIGTKMAHSLVEAGFTSIDGLVEADPSDLCAISGIGAKKAEKIVETAMELKEKKK
ncbi:MAG: transcription termination factor NusA [Candidatus Ancaeobacter aquaticus]|nr:transcription termination factor NusA [Candidatus Ancaeobacter aquaticus]